MTDQEHFEADFLACTPEQQAQIVTDIDAIKARFAEDERRNAERARAAKAVDGDDIDRTVFNLNGYGYSDNGPILREMDRETRANMAAAAVRDDWVIKRQDPALWFSMTGERVNLADDPQLRETHGDGK